MPINIVNSTELTPFSPSIHRALRAACCICRAEAEAGHVYGPKATPRCNAFTTALFVDCSVNKAVGAVSVQIIRRGGCVNPTRVNATYHRFPTPTRIIPVETKVALPLIAGYLREREKEKEGRMCDQFSDSHGGEGCECERRLR